MTLADDMRNFSESFFRNLNCKVNWNGLHLVVGNVPEAFEEALGKKGPYTLVFFAEDERDGTELVIKGSHMLKTMLTFIENKGQMTLLRMERKQDYSEIFRQRFSLQNCNLLSLNKSSVVHRAFLRFTFSSVFQYLNEKEYGMHSVIVEEGSAREIDLSIFSFYEGNKQDLPALHLDADYKQAKDHLRSLLQSRVAEIKEQLQIKAEKEIARLRAHYMLSRKEGEDEQARLMQQIQELSVQLQKKPDTKSEERLERLQDSLVRLSKQRNDAESNREEEFFIQDAIHKHSLQVENKLINTTIFYYPLHTLSIFLKSTQATRMISLNFDCQSGLFSEINCDTCKQPLSSVILCSGSHLVCLSCSRRCVLCGSEICRKCIKQGCSSCPENRIICKSCLSKCTGCRRLVCLSHLEADGLTKKAYCRQCLRMCDGCRIRVGQLYTIGNKRYCEKCRRNLVANKIISGFFD